MHSIIHILSPIGFYKITLYHSLDLNTEYQMFFSYTFNSTNINKLPSEMLMCSEVLLKSLT